MHHGNLDVLVFVEGECIDSVEEGCKYRHCCRESMLSSCDGVSHEVAFTMSFYRYSFQVLFKWSFSLKSMLRRMMLNILNAIVAVRAIQFQNIKGVICLH